MKSVRREELVARLLELGAEPFVEGNLEKQTCFKIAIEEVSYVYKYPYTEKDCEKVVSERIIFVWVGLRGAIRTHYAANFPKKSFCNKTLEKML